MGISDVVRIANSVQGATVTEVFATNVLQAEFKAEKALDRFAEGKGMVNSCDRWELVERTGNLYTIKFSCS